MIPFRLKLIRRRALVVAMLWAAAAGTARPAPDGGAISQLQDALPERSLPGLDALLRKALVHAPEVIMREWALAEAGAGALAARAPMLPRLEAWVNAGATYEQRREGAYEINGQTVLADDRDRVLAAVLFNVGFYQPVFHWGALAKNYQIGKLRQAIAARNITETRRLLALDIRRRYLDLMLAENGLQIARRDLARAGEDHRQMEQLIADGTQAAASLDGPRRDLDIIRPEVRRQEVECRMLRESLLRLAGVTAADLDALPGGLPPFAPLDAPLDALAGAGAREAAPSNGLADLRDQIEIERLNYNIQKTRLHPKFGVTLSVTQENRAPDNNVLGPKSLITSWNAFGTMNWRMFDGAETKGLRLASLNRLRALETRRVQAEKQEGGEREIEALRLQLQWERLKNTEADLGRARNGLELAGQDFAGGWASSRAVEDARVHLANMLRQASAERAAFASALAACLSSRGRDPAASGGGDF
ncbi:MAG: TolC family protein [Opitutaceae bacterium]|jgi:outer membrane protein TolC|nr:TolC family protein [Opitutaceae bacterium]